MGIDGFKITLNSRKYAAAQNLSEEEALKACMAGKSKEFAGKGAELSEINSLQDRSV